LENSLLNIAAALKAFENKILNWVAQEEVALETVASELVQAVEGVLTALKPSVVADIKTILQGLPEDFLKGGTFSGIVEEVLIQASADLKKELASAEPQVIEALVGVLVNVLVKV
jgi:hypothetical protein